jgi:phage gp45-like
MPTQIDNALIRIQLITTHDDGEQQKLEADGRSNERFGGTSSELATPRLQNYGYSSYGPAGSQGITMILNGNPDLAMIATIEHPQYRWKNLEAAGNIVEYDQWQHRRLKEKDKWTDMVGTATVLYQESGGLVHINAPASEVATWQAHRDGSRLSEDELDVLRGQEFEAEAARDRLIAEAEARHAERQRLINEKEEAAAARLQAIEDTLFAISERLDALDRKAR